MNRKIYGMFLCIALVLTFSGAAFADSTEVYAVDYFETPDAGTYAAPMGLAWDGEHIWMLDNIQRRIIGFTPDGQVVSSATYYKANPPYYSIELKGLTAYKDGNDLYLLATDFYSGAGIYRVATNGAAELMFAAPGPYPIGLAWDGSHLWLADMGTQWGDGRIYELTLSGEVVSSFHLPEYIRIPADLTYDGENLLMVGREELVDKLYKLTRTGEILASYSMSEIGVSGNPMGLTWDGRYLWLASEGAAIDGRSTDVIYKLDFNVWVLNMNQMLWYYPVASYNSTGAAVAQMITGYIREPLGLPLLGQDEIYQYAKNPQPLTGELTPDEIDKALGHFDPYDQIVSNSFDSYDSEPGGNPYQGYNYSIDTYDPFLNPDAMDEYIRDICHWMAYTVTKENWWDDGELTARPNTPAAIPIFGTYDHWVVVKGFITDKNPSPQPHVDPWNMPDFTVFGFWIKDPLYSGIGRDTYKTAVECRSTYFLPLATDASDPYNGLLLQIAEPPPEISKAHIKIPQPQKDLANLEFVGISVNGASLNSRIKKQSYRDIIDPYLLTDKKVVAAFEGTKMGKPILVKRPDLNNSDYYLVPFNKQVKDGFLTSAVVILDAKSGYFKEASWTEEPEKFLRVERRTSIELTKRYILENLSIELRKLPKESPREYSKRIEKAYRKYRRLVSYISNADAELLWQPGVYSSSPYKPYWKLDANGYIWYVTQDGEVISED